MTTVVFEIIAALLASCFVAAWLYLVLEKLFMISVGYGTQFKIAIFVSVVSIAAIIQQHLR
jgi:hypothetical protein